MERQKLKPYGIAVLLIVLYALELFVLSPFLSTKIGILSSTVVELLMAATAVAVFAIFRGKLKVIFPFKKPSFSKIAGTLVLWLGIFWAAMLVTMLIAYFFPQQVFGASQGVGDMITSVPVFLSLLMVSLTPAICEEIAFRGALLSCFRGMKHKWVAIIIVSVIFGAFHGSIWRMIPTMLLAIGMGYLLFETENMIYPMLFHLINNAVPIIMLAVLTGVFRFMGMDDVWNAASSAAQLTNLPLASIASYVTYGGAAPFLIYIGNYLLHKGQPGYERGVFPREKQKHLIAMVCVGLGMVLLGFCMAMIAVISQMNT